MRWSIVLPLLLVAPSAVARDVVSLSPYDWPGGLAPYRPTPVTADHPLYHRIALEPTVDVPDRIGSTFILVAHGRELDEALTDTLARSDLLAPPGTKPSAILTVRWLTFRLPFKIGFSADAQATLRYELRRADTGQVIFRRDVTTVAKGNGGGDASARARGTGRAVLLENVAGGIWCLDKAAYGAAPEDCATVADGAITGPITDRFVYQPAIPHR